MKSRNLLVRGLFVFVSLFFLIAMSFTTADAKCCERPGAGGSCDDGYKPGTGKCCGVHECNVLCCNCGGGCRTAPDNKDGCYKKCDSAHSTCSGGCTIACGVGPGTESCEIMCDYGCSQVRDECKKDCDNKYPSTSAEQRAFNKFNAHDKNHDSHLSKDEFGDLVKKNNMGIDENKEFEAMDKNKDGRISLEEADVPLPAAIKEKLSRKKK